MNKYPQLYVCTASSVRGIDLLFSFLFFFLLLVHSGFFFPVSLPFRLLHVASIDRQVSPFESHFLFGIPMLSSDLCPAYRFKPNTPGRGSWSGLLSCYNIAFFSLESDQTILSSVGTTVPKQKKLMLADSAKRLQNCIREGQKKKRKKKKDPLPKQSQKSHVLRRRKPPPPFPPKILMVVGRTYSWLKGIKECGDMKLSKDEGIREKTVHREYIKHVCKGGKRKIKINYWLSDPTNQQPRPTNVN